MEESAYNGLMVGVYVFIFITAISLTIFLFSSTISFSDKAYEYGKVTTGDSIIETTSAPQNNVITGAELLTYYYNYKSPDKYGEALVPKYDFQDINNIDINKTYTLIYETANTTTGSVPVIRVKDITDIEGTVGGGEVVVVDNKPTDPSITTRTSIATRVAPGSIVEFKAVSLVTTSFLTNHISKYIWRIEYSPEDGRPNFSVITYETVGDLTLALQGNALEFRKGINKVYVTSEDSLGIRSNTVSKTIDVGYNDPVINSIIEVNAKVQNNGSMYMESPSGALLTFKANAISKNGGYIQTYEWSVNGAIVQSGGTETLIKNFTPGSYSLILKVYDSIIGTTTSSFTFVMKEIPAPDVTSNNAAINGTHTVSIASGTISVTFNASLEAKYGIVKYVWNIDGIIYQTNVPNGINLNYGIGTHTISVYGVNSQGINSETKSLSFVVKLAFEDKTFNYTGGVQAFPIVATGTYKLEVWGARGGNDGTSTGGYGGYSTGNITLTAGQTIYIYAGGKSNDIPSGGSVSAVGGWNGGGNGGSENQWRFGSGGGGATDIRTSSTLASRIIVAGGGGGSDANDSEGGYSINGQAQQGGMGGGTNATIGNQGYNMGRSIDSGYATQTSGYTLGQGQDGGTNMAGGGGGYYGGKSGDSGVSNSSGGSGYTTGLSNASMQVGVNNGNGYAKITYVP